MIKAQDRFLAELLALLKRHNVKVDESWDADSNGSTYYNLISDDPFGDDTVSISMPELAKLQEKYKNGG